jgi:two-component system, cell cycle sensor histidine kinase and response regulator CckA
MSRSNAHPDAVALASLDADAYRLVFEQSPQPMWVFDEKTLVFIDVNEAAIATYGYSRDEFLRMDITQIRPPEEIPTLLQRIRSGAAHPPRVWIHLTKSGRAIDVEVASKALIIGGRAVRLAVVRDVSEHRKLEEQVRQAHKIETVGQLAGGISHDFNNLLTAILGHTEMLAEYFAPDDPRAVEIAGIRDAADLAASLTRQLLAFSRKQLLQPIVLDLNDVLDKTRRILARLIGEHIELVTEPGPSLHHVKADPGQMEQILLNLAVNSREAMPDGGRLVLRTRNVRVSRAEARRLSMKEGDHVEVMVSDTGVGIDAAAKAHLFEPFFTTKDRIRGTGLGLATVYGIVKQSEGYIDVESEPGCGTTFKIYLPATRELPAHQGVHDRLSGDGGSETVLVVEDDHAVRSLIGDVLRRRGYRLLVAESGRQAMELLSKHEGPIDLLITDMVLSGMNGLAVADAMRATHPSIKVLYVSGYADDALMPSGFFEASGACLQKPFTPVALVRKVRGVIEEGR